MRRTLLRALVFAGAVVAVSLAIDLLLTVVYQGGPRQGRTREFLVFRSALHGATFVLTAIGATLGFALLQSYSITIKRIALLGGALGLFALGAVLTAVHIGGFRGISVLLLVASGLIAFFGGKLLGTKEAHA